MAHQRDRAWRRARAAQSREQKSTAIRTRDHAGIKSKRWYEVYWRRNKLKRAQQTGRIWPMKEWDSLMSDAQPVRLLFVCSKNQWRSPTGERMFAGRSGFQARSAGTARSAVHQITMKDIQWADVIFVMEDKHAQRLKADFRQAVSFKPLHVLDIPDDYQFMDSELVELIETGVSAYLSER